jgi:hypothetical protein
MRSPSTSTPSILFRITAVAVALLIVGCDGASTGSSSNNNNNGGGSDSGTFTTSNCTIPTDRIVTGCNGADCIPSIDGITPGDDRLVSGNPRGLGDSDRVIGLVFDGQAMAVPLSILWTHEIVNVDEWGGRRFAVTYCPLTGSSLAFDRRPLDGAELGVSGLLFNNNLVMYDRRDETSLWPQMSRRATCGANIGTDLSMLPVVEMRWGRWQELHPETQIVSDGNTDFDRSYPYGNYRAPDSNPLIRMPVDDRRPPKELVLGIPINSVGGLALPFGEFEDGMNAQVVTVTVGATEKIVFWRRDAQTAMAFETSRTFSVQNGEIVDEETGSVWSVEGRAIEGPLAEQNAQLTQVESAYVSFWFAWAAFQPETQIWERS